MAIAFVQDAVANSTGGTTTLAVTISPAAGNTLVVQSGLAGTQTITGITDNTGSNTYTKRAGVTNTVTAEVWTSVGIVAGVTTVTITYSATSTGNAAVVSEYSGVSGVGANGTNTGTASTPETITLAIGPNSYTVASLANNLGSTESLTPATGNLRDHTASGAGAATVQTAAVDNTSVNAASVVTSVTLGAGVNWAAAAAELQPISTNDKVPQFLSATSGIVGASTSQGIVDGQLLSASGANPNIWRTAGIFTGMYLRVPTNTGTIVVNFKKNGVTGAQTISVASSATGEFQDTANYDQVASGDTVNFFSTAVGASTTTLFSINFASSNSAQTLERFGTWAAATAGTNIELNNATRFYVIDGRVPATSGLVAEASAQFKIKTSGTFQNLQITVPSNSRTTTTTFRTRIGGVNGNLVISIAAGITGTLEDTTHSDSVVSGNLVNYSFTFGAEATAFNVYYMGVEFMTVNGAFHFVSGNTALTTQAVSLTRYYGLSGGAQNSATESDFQASRIAATLSNLECFLTQNTVSAASTLKLRKNAGNGSQSVSITASTTGYFEDVVNTDSVVFTDEVDYQLITGGTGTQIQFTSIGVLAATAGSASPGFPGLPPGTRLLPMTGVGV